MMATTHVLAGMLVGLAVAPLSPGGATPVVLAGAAGGMAPDLDALRTHRRDLHFPVYGSVLAAVVLGLAAVTHTAWVVGAAAFLGAAALHAVSDVLDGGRSVRPWAEPVERAVYCHAQGRWWQPRRLVAYDGAPGDVALAVCLAVPTAAFVTGDLRVLVAGLVVASVAYGAVRRRVPDVVDALATRLDGRVDRLRTGRRG